MSNIIIPAEPSFDIAMRALEKTDPADAGLFNGMFEQLLENDSALKKETESKEDKHLSLVATLITGDTTVIFEDDGINVNSTIDFYADKFGVSPTSAVVEEGKITVVFPAQNEDLSVKVVIS